MAGNPDQQEDTLDDQYQEDLEDEVCNLNLFQISEMSVVQNIKFTVYCLLLLKAQEDVAGGQKRDVLEEDPYNEDNIEQVSFQQNQNQDQFFC